MVSSDEVSMYLTLERLVKFGSLSLNDTNAPNSIIFKDKVYSWYEIGNILTGIPLYLIGQLIITIFSMPEHIEAIIPRAIVSYTSAIIGVILAILFHNMCKKLGLSISNSVIFSLILTFSTPLLPYYKLFMREALLSLCLFSGFYYLFNYNANLTKKKLLISGVFIGYGILTKLVFAINIIPLALYIFMKNNDLKSSLRQLITFIVPVIFIGFIGTGLYNYLKFQDPLNMGIGGGTTFPIPCYVGTYGLLFSSGKGIFWFTPILILLPFVLKYFYQKFPKETLTILSIFILNLLLYCKYIMWGGDGSWGPRYLIPTIPLLLIPIAYYFKNSNINFKRIVIVLSLIGTVIQFGGVAIYAGAYLREIDEVPFKKNFTDPEFLYKAHYIPNHSPIIGHWRMFSRNIYEHLKGDYPHLSIKREFKTDRIPIRSQDESKLLHTIDFWFTYALYVGIPFNIIIFPLLVIFSFSFISGFLLWKKIKQLNE